PPGCGKILKAKESKQFLIDKLGFPSGVRDEFMFCNYWIEVYAHDAASLGEFCSPNDRNTVLVSASNRVPVITFNRSGQQQIILEYKIVS
ncbi:hypothetical protein OSTOST_25634, partial [Ostertagia ostertagi]